MSLRLGKEGQGQVWEGARGPTLLLSAEGSRAKETTPSSAPTPRCSLLPLGHPSSPSSPLGPEPLSIKECHTTTTTSPLQHFPISTVYVTGSDAGLLTPEHAFTPQLHCAPRGCRRGAVPQTHGHPSAQLLRGAWLAQSSQLWGPALVGRGRRQGIALPLPQEATEECLHAKQNVISSPTLSQSLHGLCPPCTRLPPPQHPGSRCHD